MSEREQKVELIQHRLMEELKKSDGDWIRIRTETAIEIVFILDQIRAILRMMDEMTGGERK